MMKSPPHIGLFVREIVEGHGLNVTTAARALGVTRQALSVLVNCDGGLSPEMALRLEKAFGIDMGLLLRMQASYETAAVRRRADAIDVRRFATAA